MKTHYFEDEDLRILASIAIDQHTDHLFFKVIRFYDKKENYWSFDCRFTHDEEQFDTYYDSLHINAGNFNELADYQMCWTKKTPSGLFIKPITSPLLVVFQFNQLLQKELIKMN